jgi:hypothetical protein
MADTKIHPGAIVLYLRPGNPLQCKVLQVKGDWVEVEILSPEEQLPSSFWVERYKLAPL